MSDKTLFLFFTAGDRQYILPLSRVKRVIPLESLSMAPLLKDFFEGLFKYEGEITALLDLPALHGNQGTENTTEPLVLLYKIDKKLIGLKIDQVDSVDEFDASNLVRLDCGLEGVEKKAVLGDIDFLYFDLDSLSSYHAR